VTGPLYVEHLYDAEIINANKFSFYFQYPGEISWMDLGEPNEALFEVGSTPATTQLIDPDFWWGFHNTGVAFGNESNAFAYENTDSFPNFVQDNSIYSIIDTGSTALVISKLYYESLIRNLFEEAGIDDWQYTQGVVLTRCWYDLPSIFFQIDGYWAEARAEDYMYDYFGTG